jgi:hypothetical protein
MLGRFRGLAPKTQYLNACQRAHEYLEYYIKRALSETVSLQSEQHSMIQGLAAQTDSIVYIRSQVLQGMMASQDNSCAYREYGLSFVALSGNLCGVAQPSN